ncbi:AMP-binding protein, partial [Pseudomonas sp.]|uniref:AMP-binding protein n=1 Tax=Pseudomonas sp. TaxID=306 RepID=UPI0029B24C11
AAVAEQSVPLDAAWRQPGDEQAWLAQASGAQADYGECVAVHRQFEAQARLRPDAVALVGDDRTLTYAQLNQRANALAWRLMAQGAGSDRLVGISARRSAELVIGLLAILKAGAAYVPLDPDYPAERLAYMMQDSGLSLLVAQDGLALAVPPGIAVLSPDDAVREDDPAIAVHPDSLAYAIYTSGSTGQPKCAANHHRALHNRLAWMQQDYGLGPDDVVLQKTPFSFDVSVWEFFWPLAIGARLALAAPGEHRDPRQL